MFFHSNPRMGSRHRPILRSLLYASAALAVTCDLARAIDDPSKPLSATAPTSAQEQTAEQLLKRMQMMEQRIQMLEAQLKQKQGGAAAATPAQNGGAAAAAAQPTTPSADAGKKTATKAGHLPPPAANRRRPKARRRRRRPRCGACLRYRATLPD